MDLAILTGFIGGVAGLISAVWTIVWSITLRPRVRWSLNRFDEHPRQREQAGIDVLMGSPDPLRFYFRNIGSVAADDAHALLIKPWDKPIEFPSDGRLRVEPGRELVVHLSAKSIHGGRANRPYAEGTDNVFDLKGVRVKIRWRRQTFGFARRTIWLNKKQVGVPFV